MSTEVGGPSFEASPEVPVTPEKLPEQPGVKSVEQAPARQESGVAKKAPQPVFDDVSDVAATFAPAIPADEEPPKPPSSPATADLTATEANSIEKGWVDRTKSVVSQTKNDPHQQKHELSKVKADYIHKRFNKIIKTDDTSKGRTGDAAVA